MDKNLLKDGKHGKIYISREEIREKTMELANQIENDYKNKDKELVIVTVLRGAAIFAADLVRNINLELSMDFMMAKSYGDELTSSGELKMIMDLADTINGKDVIIVEDIIETGNTLYKLIELLKGRNPNSIKVCSLLSKKIKRNYEVNVDYVGFEISDEFVIGYGLDAKYKYRNLKDIEIY